MKINIITTVPEYFDSMLTTSILGRAVKNHLVDIERYCLRDFADGKNKKQVDDAPYGGGPGMILKIEPIVRCLRLLEQKGQKGLVYLTSAGGEVLTQTRLQTWTQTTCLTFICGHYEGVDARIKHYIDGEISLGQFVLTGGEPAVGVMIDALVRLLPGVLGNDESLAQESFTDGLIEYPQYTRPAVFEGHAVPEVLLSGHHQLIAQWRAKHCLTCHDTSHS